ncbi:MAG: diaminopropionate ammonia-lyase [Gammaproteobacteria bacterium]|nr:diaminopropionate ammonia-lyase [Gammaproteobacteria bacterium]
MNQATTIDYIVNPRARDGRPGKADTANFGADIAASVQNFHRSFEDYKPSPLVSLTDLAHSLGAAAISVKDESNRLGLDAFKVLGASHAMAKFLAHKLDTSLDQLSFDAVSLATLKTKLGECTFVTATDGNHGRAVAWAARQLGQRAVVYLPSGSAAARVTAIRSLGAEACVTDVNYDDSVRHAAAMAEQHDWILLQDTAWPGYEQIPLWIMQGYLTMYAEALEQLGADQPTHVFIQAGVGSLASALQAYLRECYGDDCPLVVVVEPTNAACFYHSVKAASGTPETVPGELKTIMAGLAAGRPSDLAWPIIRDYSDYFFSCSDSVAIRGMRILAHPVGNDRAVVSGEAGAVTTGLVVCLCEDTQYRDIANGIGISPKSKILLFSTEGATDPDSYQRLVTRAS